MMRHSRHLLVASVLVALATMSTGCVFPDPDRSTMTAQEQFDELMKRPDIQEAKKRYGAMQAKVRAKLAEELDLPRWTTDPKTGRDRSCGDFPDVHTFDKNSFLLPLWSTDGLLDADQWSRAKEVLRRVTNEYGFTVVELDSNGDDASVYELADGKGASVGLMDNPQNLLVLRVSAGCHLEPEAKERGRPISEEEKASYRNRPAAAPSVAPPVGSEGPATKPNPPDSSLNVASASGPIQAHPSAEPPHTRPVQPPPRGRLSDEDEGDYDDMNFLR